MTSTTRLHATVGTRAHRSVPGRGRGWPSVAAERLGGYDTHDDGGTVIAHDDAPPFGLPVLAELPALATVLEQLTAADRAMLGAVAGLADLLATDDVPSTTGVGIDHWLAAVASQTRMDRRLLVRTCQLMHRLPALDAAVRTGRVSFAQLRGLALALRSAPTELDDDLDRLLTALLDGLDRFDRPDPDVLVRQVADALDELRPDDLAAREQDATDRRHLTIQPYLDGTGGRFHGELDAPGLALLDATTTPPAALLDHPGGVGAARADALLARLADADARELDGDTGDGDAREPAEDAPTARWRERLQPPKLLLRLPFAALLDERVPADLLTTLVGGRLRLTSAAAGQLLDERGALLRTIVVDDDGTVVGVGRSTRRQPGWLSDVLDALHDTCTGPGCDRAARGADVDHAVPWWPTGPDEVAGSTDVDNVGPLCPATNRQKEAAGWRVTQSGAGVRTWHHPRSGLTTTAVPATWRAPDDPRRHRDTVGEHRPPPRPAPPGT
ncbi:HNH endonuclease signature motif containing protein [Nitriliruptor alkaliphilus]|uniref:HNH endonuclease signature motif containing protein n=1 Tax=Nitriliruptor alkaliphilus TaxID=427918 RepID=UPI0006982B30|nr:HNH endonuclease signature motif containing protein [Nitriliruptor alkaliphilus]